MPNGVAFRQGALYVAEVSRVRRYDAIEDHLAAPPAPVTVIDGLPSEHHHGWKFIAFGPDDLLYVPVGAPCNVCEPSDPRFASILRFRPTAHPWTRWRVECGTPSGSTGSPGAARSGSPTTAATSSGTTSRRTSSTARRRRPSLRLSRLPRRDDRRSRLTPRAATAGCSSRRRSPSAPTWPRSGCASTAATMFPEEYRGQVFIAEHGSWNRSHKIGYRVTLVRVKDGQAVSYRAVRAGLAAGRRRPGAVPRTSRSCPTARCSCPTSKAGAIYRITYAPPLLTAWRSRWSGSSACVPVVRTSSSAATGTAGDWARLFRRGEGYVGTVLLRDLATPGRYLVTDTWRDAAAYRAFKERPRRGLRRAGPRMHGPHRRRALPRRVRAALTALRPPSRYVAATLSRRPGA